MLPQLFLFLYSRNKTVRKLKQYAVLNLFNILFNFCIINKNWRPLLKLDESTLFFPQTDFSSDFSQNLKLEGVKQIRNNIFRQLQYIHASIHSCEMKCTGGNFHDHVFLPGFCYLKFLLVFQFSLHNFPSQFLLYFFSLSHTHQFPVST